MTDQAGDPETDGGFPGAERPVAEPPPPPPRAAVWRLLRASAERDEAGRDTLRTERELRFELADAVARAVHELRTFADRHAPSGTAPAAGPDTGRTSTEQARTGRPDTRGDPGTVHVVADRLDAALGRAGVTVVDPVGRPFAEVRDWADPLPGAPAVPVERLVVRATVVPAVHAGDRLLVRARVELGCATDTGEGSAG